MRSLFEGIGRLAKMVGFFIGLLVLAVSAVGLLFYLRFSKDLPKISRVTDYRPPVVSEVFSDDGTKIGEFWQECRFLVPYEKIPKRIIEAFVASEDERFWEHRGVDVRSIVRAFVKNLQAGHVVQGGSTITQQVTRSLLLTREKKMERKIKEALLATQLEQNLSKEQILYLYLNQIYLGNRAYGIQAAARNYFRKNLEDLNLAEIALIAGLPSAPNSYSPINNPEMARRQQLRVLSRMFETHYISKREMDEALKSRLTIYTHGTDKDFNNQYAPYFIEQVRQMVEQKQGKEALYLNGLKIETTANVVASQVAQEVIQRSLEQIDRQKPFRGPITVLKKKEIPDYAESVYQELAFETGEPFLFPVLEKDPPKATPLEEGKLYKGIVLENDKQGNTKILIGRMAGWIQAANRGRTTRSLKRGEVYSVRKKGDYFTIDQEPEIEGALYSLNPLTNEVKAIVGGYRFRRSEFNRAVQAMRQPGSAFKPVIYAAALDKGYSPQTVITDAPVVYQVNADEYWNPRNYGEKYNGPMSLRAALAYSVNVIAVKVLHEIGTDYLVGYARKLGIVSPLHKYLSSALGTSDLTLQEITRAYGTFPAGGIRPEPVMIRKITDREEKVLEENPLRSLNASKIFESRSTTEPDVLNDDLMVEGEKVIKKERLNLSADERKILYGGSVPPGHVISPQTAYLMIHLMKSVVEIGTATKAKELGRPVAGKTGTTNEESDAWFIGMIPDLITGVWVGFDSLKPIGEKMTGGVVAAPIWLDYMKVIVKEKPVQDFVAPSWIDLAKIDSLSGGSAVVATKRRPPSETVPVAGEPTKSRAIDFLFEDLNKQ